ncbi:MAG: hypothetical protein JWP09_807 [Candidatus Taylorbacteria bacterium]|nr:hypothetical protein [Candidatus Taylorbacteria bacterium]
MNFDSLGLTKSELAILRRLNTPIKIQNFIDDIPTNFELDGETNKSPRRTLRENKAHCLEGALLAALALWINGHKPLIMDMKSTDNDVDHVIAPFKINGYWGCVSKTNHATIRYRDPVYKTIRELAMSYFHEWFMDVDGTKTLRSFSEPYDLRKFKKNWITEEKDLWEISELLDSLKHFKVAPEKNIKMVRVADAMERKAGKIQEWGRDGKRL